MKCRQSEHDWVSGNNIGRGSLSCRQNWLRERSQPLQAREPNLRGQQSMAPQNASDMARVASVCDSETAAFSYQDFLWQHTIPCQLGVAAESNTLRKKNHKMLSLYARFIVGGWLLHFQVHATFLLLVHYTFPKGDQAFLYKPSERSSTFLASSKMRLDELQIKMVLESCPQKN